MNFVFSKEKELDCVYLEQKLFLFITISKIRSNQGIHHLQQLINSPLQLIRVLFSVEFCFPFLWRFKVFAVIVKDFETDWLLERQKSNPCG